MLLSRDERGPDEAAGEELLRRGAAGYFGSFLARVFHAGSEPLDALSVLIVDDDLLGARLLKAQLHRPGRLDVEVVGSGAEALERLGRRPFDAVIADVQMPEMDGIELVRRLRRQNAGIPVLLLTAEATIERAVEGIRAGASEFLSKPANVGALVTLLERAVTERPVREAVLERLDRQAHATAESYIRGAHPRLEAVRAFAVQVAAVADARVFITGETGTGKSRLAQAIHDLSGTAGRLVEINCAALPPHLLETELFGHERGAFTDAKELKRGLIELAERGTLLLDEIGTLPLELQAKLLSFIERREIRRVGGTQSIPTRCRIIAATNENLWQRVRDKTFRQDLLYRLDVASVEMPPLREVPAVIPELAEHFTRQLVAESVRALPELDAESFARLREYPWPGNARELHNAVERALIFHRSGPLRVHPPAESNLPPAPSDGVVIPHGLPLDEVERRYLEAALARRQGELAELAEELGIARKTLWEKRRRYGL